MKKENSTLVKKLKTYSAVAGTVLAAGQAADAQIVYTDLNPDVDVPLNSAYGLDLNNDSNADYAILLYTGGASRTAVFIGGYGGNKIAGVQGNYGTAYIYPVVLNAGDEVGPGLDFYSMEGASGHPSLLTLGSHSFYFQGTFGYWFGTTDGYLGLSFDDGGNKYGWARMDVGDIGSPQVTIKDYAFNDNPDTPINAGDDGSLGITSVSAANSISVFAFEKSVYISASKINDGKLFITVTNTGGQVMRAVSTEHSSFKLGLNDLSDGIYLVTVQNGNEVMTKKVSMK